MVTDFWGPYEAIVAGDKQKCWAHLLRELDAPKNPPGADWDRFGGRVKRLFKEAIALRGKRDELSTDDYDLAIVRLENRALGLANEEWDSADARRLAKRLTSWKWITTLISRLISVTD